MPFALSNWLMVLNFLNTRFINQIVVLMQKIGYSEQNTIFY